MDKLGDWYFDDSNEDCGQNLFNKFAEAHMHLLPDECDPKNLAPVDISDIIATAAKAEVKLTQLYTELIKNM